MNNYKKYLKYKYKYYALKKQIGGVDDSVIITDIEEFKPSNMTNFLTILHKGYSFTDADAPDADANAKKMIAYLKSLKTNELNDMRYIRVYIPYTYSHILANIKPKQTTIVDKVNKLGVLGVNDSKIGFIIYTKTNLLEGAPQITELGDEHPIIYIKASTKTPNKYTILNTNNNFNILLKAKLSGKTSTLPNNNISSARTKKITNITD